MKTNGTMTNGGAPGPPVSCVSLPLSEGGGNIRGWGSKENLLSHWGQVSEGDIGTLHPASRSPPPPPPRSLATKISAVLHDALLVYQPRHRLESHRTNLGNYGPREALLSSKMTSSGIVPEWWKCGKQASSSVGIGTHCMGSKSSLSPL